jgi:energy-coupling factor transporter ATP-binding protein EcfA2
VHKSISNELLSFAASRSSWQQDAIRRIATQAELSEEDFAAILQNLKASQLLCSEADHAPLTSSNLSSGVSNPQSLTRLLAINDVRNANRLASGQALVFGLSGITLIYGYNGSGKSGYARIIKQICRSRDEKKTPILADVFAGGQSSPATATIAYELDGQVKGHYWTDGEAPPGALSYISVFDSATAPLYADKQNRIEFLPAGLDVLPRLGKVCEKLSAALSSEIDSLKSRIIAPLPQVSSELFTKRLERLQDRSDQVKLPSKSDLDTAFTWSDADGEERLKLEERIRALSSPAQALAQLERFIGALRLLLTRFEPLEASLKPEHIDGLTHLSTELLAARAAEKLASQNQFSMDPLGPVPTTSAWRKLFKAAEEFSAEIYPDTDFPAIGEERVCLLCQQFFDSASADRMKKFKEFLQTKTQQEADVLRNRYEAHRRQIAELKIPTSEDVSLTLAELVAISPERKQLQVLSEQFCDDARKLQKHILQQFPAVLQEGALQKEGSQHKIDSHLLLELQSQINSLKAESDELSQTVTDDKVLKELNQRYLEILDRQVCNEALPQLQERLNVLQELQSIRRCKDACDTGAISRKSSSLREAHLTADFSDRLKAEISTLGLSYLPIKVEGRSSRGEAFLGATLTKSGRESNSQILSEGEFRGLALACFFAEIASIPGRDGIVIDDPVSSLDHLHVEQIASRLVQEARNREQIIVFTHDLSFYYQLWMAAAEAQVPVHRNWIFREGSSGFGKVASNEGPWQIKKVKERIKYLDDVLKEMSDQETSFPPENQKNTESFYAKLRETWERLVEECLLNDVVGRFQPGVQTQSLKGVSVNDEDYRKVFFAMKKASEFSGHDRPAGRPPVIRSKSDMKADLDELRSYEQELRKRKQELETQRRALETPPAAKTRDFIFQQNTA